MEFLSFVYETAIQYIADPVCKSYEDKIFDLKDQLSQSKGLERNLKIELQAAQLEIELQKDNDCNVKLQASQLECMSLKTEISRLQDQNLNLSESVTQYYRAYSIFDKMLSNINSEDFVAAKNIIAQIQYDKSKITNR